MSTSTLLSEPHQTDVRRMLGEGKTPIDIRAIFHAVPERSREAVEAFNFAQSFTEVEVFVLTDLRADQKEERKEARRQIEALRIAREHAQREAAARSAVEESGPVLSDGSGAAPRATTGVAPKESNLINGHFLTAIIRWLASNGVAQDAIAGIIAEHRPGELNPSTISIQFRKGLKGENIPEIEPDFAKRLLPKKLRAIKKF